MAHRLGLLIGVGVATTAVICGAAGADGLPVLGIDDGSTGVTVPGSPYRFVTLPANARVLALIEPGTSFPRRETTLAVLGTRGFPLQRLVRLRGDFSFDAISPSSDRLYLIQYLSPTDPNTYALRAYDVRSGRLLSKPIVDPHDRDARPAGRARDEPGRPLGLHALRRCRRP